MLNSLCMVKATPVPRGGLLIPLVEVPIRALIIRRADRALLIVGARLIIGVGPIVGTGLIMVAWLMTGAGLRVRSRLIIGAPVILGTLGIIAAVA